MTDEESELTLEKMVVEHLSFSIGYLLQARGRVDLMLGRVMLVQIGGALAGPTVVPKEFFKNMQEATFLLPNEVGTIRFGLAYLSQQGLPEAMVLLEPASSDTASSAATLLALCRSRQDIAVVTLLMAGIDEIESSLTGVNATLTLYSDDSVTALTSALQDLQPRTERLLKAINYEIELCRILYDLVVRASGIGKMM